jgi:hypothetical protein
MDINKDVFEFVAGDDPEKLLVIFSAANATGFTLYKDLTKFKGYDKIFIRDPYLTAWYQSGVGGGVSNPDQLTQLIINSCRNKSTQIYAAGISMGGYASILCGLLGRFHGVLAIAPQVRLKAGVFRNPSRNTKIIYPNLDALYNEGEANTSIYILAGMHDYTDMYHLSCLSGGKNVTPFVFTNADHSLPKHIHASSGLGHLVNQFVRQEKLEFSLPYSASISDIPWRDALSSAMTLYYDRKYVAALSELDAALKSYPDWVGGYIFKARLCKDIGEMQSAESNWLISLEIVPHLTESLHQLHYYYKSIGNDALASYFLALYSRVRKVKKGGVKALDEMAGML